MTHHPPIFLAYFAMRISLSINKEIWQPIWCDLACSICLTFCKHPNLREFSVSLCTHLYSRYVSTSKYESSQHTKRACALRLSSLDADAETCSSHGKTVQHTPERIILDTDAGIYYIFQAIFMLHILGIDYDWSRCEMAKEWENMRGINFRLKEKETNLCVCLRTQTFYRERD